MAEEAMKKSEKIRFIVELEKGVDGRVMYDELKTYATDKGYENVELNVYEITNLKKYRIMGTTTPEAYEKLFDAELKYHEHQAPMPMPLIVGEWVEARHAQVPAQFKGKIESIGLLPAFF